MTSSAQRQLIENAALNQERIHDIVERASYASGLRVTHPLSVTLIGRPELGKILELPKREMRPSGPRSRSVSSAEKDPEDVLESSRDRFGPLSDAPTLVRDLTVFPYTYGYRFTYHEGKLGLQSPPASTEQIIHLERTGRRAFQAIDLSDFARLLETEGCRVLYQDTMGELTLSLWLRNIDSTITQSVWDGWDGDRWIAAECENGREVAWLTSWDTEKNAFEFETTVTGIAATVQERANLKTPLAAQRQGREVVVASGELWSKIGDLKRLAIRARVKTRAELAGHFARVQ